MAAPATPAAPLASVNSRLTPTSMTYRRPLFLGKIGWVPLKDVNFSNVPLKDHLFAM
jgi:hypothetical protein